MSPKTSSLINTIIIAPFNTSKKMIKAPTFLPKNLREFVPPGFPEPCFRISIPLIVFPKIIEKGIDPRKYEISNSTYPNIIKITPYILFLLNYNIRILNTYNEESIQILEELEAVRKRPGMYIGSTDSRGLHHLVWEIVDNAIDEVLAGYGSEIIVTVKEDNSIVVKDNGRGVPVGMHKSGKSAIEIIYTKLHAGGKFGQAGGYKVSGGLHGVGASVVNALSEYVDVTVNRDGKIYNIKFTEGGQKVSKLKVIGETKETGTTVWFKPMSDIFTTTLFSYSALTERLRESAFLLKGLKVILIDERSKSKDEYFYKDGIISYVDFID